MTIYSKEIKEIQHKATEYIASQFKVYNHSPFHLLTQNLCD